MTAALKPADFFPQMTLPTVTHGPLPFGPKSGWFVFVVYRGRHCARCKPYLRKLEALAPQFAALDVQVVAASADPLDRAGADVAELELSIPVVYDLGPDQMRQLGLYVSDSIKPAETGRPFAEPGVIVVNGEGRVHIMATSNSASVRPDLDELLDGVTSIQAKSIPIRGLAR